MGRKIQKNILTDYEGDFSKHIPEEQVERTRLLWNAIPSQLVKENKKCVYGKIKIFTGRKPERWKKFSVQPPNRSKTTRGKLARKNSRTKIR